MDLNEPIDRAQYLCRKVLDLAGAVYVKDIPPPERCRAIIFSVDAQNIAVVKRKRPGVEPYAVLPGGGVEEHDTTPIKALWRELDEELSVSSSDVKLITDRVIIIDGNQWVFVGIANKKLNTFVLGGPELQQNQSPGERGTYEPAWIHIQKLKTENLLPKNIRQFIERVLESVPRSNNIPDLVEQEMFEFASPSDAIFLQRFFKTGPGQYGEGDKFLGVRNPQTRSVAQKYYKEISNEELIVLLQSSWHEIRLCALVMMGKIFLKATPHRQKQLYEIYLKNISKYVNNWDLVDLSAPNIAGKYLVDKNRDILYKLAQGDLWQKRVSILATFAFIRNNDFSDSLRISEILMYEKHDLLHKAIGWMLREIGKRDEQLLLDVLNEYAPTMPRTTLRYSIEKLPEALRKHYLSLKNIK